MLLLSTWSFGQIANRAGFPILAAGGSALDAVEQAAIAVELDPSVDSVGIGGLPDSSGRLSLDGCVMLSPRQSAGVACLRRHAHPVSIARKLMEQTPHKLLVGPDADDFADQCGFPQVNLLIDPARQRYEKWTAERNQSDRDRLAQFEQRANREEMQSPKPHDTVGILALDSHGILAGACSTSGLPFKLPGRVGDSPILGHGLYVDPRAGAAVTTGRGELMMGINASFLAVELMRNGASPTDAARAVLHRLASSYDLLPSDQCGIITLSPNGTWSSASLLPGFRLFVTTNSGEQSHDPALHPSPLAHSCPSSLIHCPSQPPPSDK